MRTHDHDVDGGWDLRTKANRVELGDPALTYRAAVAGRADALGPDTRAGMESQLEAAPLEEREEEPA
jgi:hypothetical protein